MNNRLRNARLLKLMSQSELGDLVGVSKNAISSYERGEFLPRINVAFKLCKVLDCDIYWLFYFEEAEQ